MQLKNIAVIDHAHIYHTRWLKLRHLTGYKPDLSFSKLPESSLVHGVPLNLEDTNFVTVTEVTISP